MVRWEKQNIAQLQHSCFARGLDHHVARQEMIRQLRDYDSYPRVVSHPLNSSQPTQSEDHKDKKARVATFMPTRENNLTPIDTSVLDCASSSRGAPTASTISLNMINEPTTESKLTSPSQSSVYDDILKDFLERERKLALREGSLLERERLQNIQQTELDNKSQEVRVKESDLNKRGQTIGNIETTRKYQSQEAMRLSLSMAQIAQKEQNIEKKERSLAEQEDRITQRTGTEQQQNEKEQRLGQWEYQLTKKEESLQQREDELTARETQDALSKLSSVLRDIHASQAEKASDIIHSVFHSPRLSRRATIISRVNSKPSQALLESMGLCRSNEAGDVPSATGPGGAGEVKKNLDSDLDRLDSGLSGSAAAHPLYRGARETRGESSSRAGTARGDFSSR